MYTLTPLVLDCFILQRPTPSGPGQDTSWRDHKPAAPRYMKMKPDEDHQERPRDQAAERTLRSLMTASANAQSRIGALAEMYSREGRERTPEESAEMLALMRVQRARGR